MSFASENPPMSLKERIQEDMKAAMRAGAKDRLGCIRLILAAIKQREVDERVTLDDAQLVGVLEKMGKQRRDSIAQFHAGGRADLVAKENAELSIISSYMPAQMSDAEIETLIGTAIAETGATSIKDMGKVMGIIKSKAQGRADMATVGARIKARLS
ncbi:MAG TPA: GatB/YqeY domain-containing protein [Steroidobacteraceae bacterium]